ncbi:MAG: hypothetical protein KY395_03950 [Actinobacteria bacterium]|nr:hypothetical protein [Actinomycetota bacterium]
MLVAIAAVALLAAPLGPPPLAEFAPAAGATISEAPPGQTMGGEDGSGCTSDPCDAATTTGAGGSNVAGPMPNADDPPEGPEGPPRVRRCVGNPPRQTEDPQSPPCVNFSEPTNVGATWQGVTAHTVRVAVPSPYGDPPESAAPHLQPIVDFFNARYEFHGRRLEITVFNPDPSSEGAARTRDASIQQAAAIHVDEELHAFASTTWDFVEMRATTYYDELARRGVVSVDSASTFRTGGDLRAKWPYQWSYALPFDELQRTLGEFSCASLAGHHARYGGAAVADKVRRFATVYAAPYGNASGGRPDTSPFAERLRGCSAEHRSAEFPYGSLDSTGTKQILLDLANEGTTTITCLCTVGELHHVMKEADQVGYQPEWLMPGLAEHDNARTGGLAPVTQRSHMFGLLSGNKPLPVADEPWYWAYKEVRPDYSNPTTLTFMPRFYRDLLVLAAGIQAAGRNLTPNTFGAALQRLRFSNPGAGQAPYWQARVGFSNDTTMIDDVGLLWWSETAGSQSRDALVKGGWCVVARGARYSRGQWPRGDPGFFAMDKPCR